MTRSKSPAPRPFWNVRTILGATCVVLLGTAVLRATPPAVHAIEVDGRHREYLLHVPDACAASEEPVPLVLVLHGGGGTARATRRTMGWDALARREGFIVAYPQGYERHWNDGRGDLAVPTVQEGVDDVKFLSTLVEHLAGELPIDRRRVYSTGASNGAMMSFRLAVDAPGLLAAISTQIGNLPKEHESKTPEPIPVMMINGTEDPLVPWHGGHVTVFGKRRGAILSAPATAAWWVARNGIDAEAAEMVELDDADPDDGTRVERVTWRGEGPEVVLYRVVGGGHTVPGGRQYLPERVIGRTSRDIDALPLVWEFLSRHRRAGADGAGAGTAESKRAW